MSLLIVYGTLGVYKWRLLIIRCILCNQRLYHVFVCTGQQNISTLVFQIFPILHWYFRFFPFYIGISDFPHFTLVFQIFPILHWYFRFFSFYIGISDFPHFTLVFQIQISDYDDIHKEVDYVWVSIVHKQRTNTKMQKCKKQKDFKSAFIYTLLHNFTFCVTTFCSKCFDNLVLRSMFLHYTNY